MRTWLTLKTGIVASLVNIFIVDYCLIGNTHTSPLHIYVDEFTKQYLRQAVQKFFYSLAIPSIFLKNYWEKQ